LGYPQPSSPHHTQKLKPKKKKKKPKRKKKKDKDPCVGGYKKMVKRGRSGDGPTTVRHTA